MDPDEFLDYLVNCIRNDVLSIQRYFSLTRSKYKKKLLADLADLKLNFTENSAAIFSTERQLFDILDKESKNEVAKFQHFELVNSEKITPEFVKLAISINTGYSLSDICNDDGSPFRTESERKKFIKEFFADIYKKNPL